MSCIWRDYLLIKLLVLFRLCTCFDSHNHVWDSPAILTGNREPYIPTYTVIIWDLDLDVDRLPTYIGIQNADSNARVYVCGCFGVLFTFNNYLYDELCKQEPKNTLLSYTYHIFLPRCFLYLFIWHLSQSYIRPSIYFSSIVKSRSKPFLEPTRTNQ